MTNQENHISDRLYSAIELAFKLHGRDARKSSKIPVMAHLLSVCALVQYESDDEDEAIAALLHDALEDKPQGGKTKENIREQFGEKVLQIVEISTDTPPNYIGGPKSAWKSRKKAYINHIRETEPALLRVTVADKVDNVRSILATHRQIGEEIWKRFNAEKKEQQWYYEEVLKAYEDANFKGALLEEFKELVKKLQSL